MFNNLDKYNCLYSWKRYISYLLDLLGKCWIEMYLFILYLLSL